ncbi:MAG: SusC/RagA family TonB-linked outer membrane protein [Tannerellaceae bacterium]|nr:SusC/RagA family TonB-linked outer membrane protein [Tannerellaceae bacterium]
MPTTDLITAMQGKIPGLNIQRNDATPGADVSIKVRGTNSISYGTSPVYVIDGIVAEEGLRLINPDDIASIEVLKDASSTALYGSKASNGVVVITTKRGKKGQGKINYSGFVTFSKYQDKLKTLNALETFNLRRDAYANGYMDVKPDADRAACIRDYILGTNEVFSAEEMENGLNNNTSNWIDEIIRTGVEHNHSLSFAGGTDMITYYLGATYSNNEGILQNSSYERFSGRVNLDIQVKPWLKVGTNTSILRGIKNRLDDNAYETALLGNRLQTKDTDRYYMYYQGTPQMGMYNPILTKEIDSREIHDRVLTANYLEANPYPNLYIRTSLSADIYNKHDASYTPSYIGQSIRNNDQGKGWHWRGQTTYYQWDTSISYEKTFTQKHRLFALVSTSASKNKTNNISMTGYGFPTDALGYHNMGMASNKSSNSMSSEYKTNTLSSYIARANYSYDNRYLLTATVRRDGSSKFADGNRWGTFPSFSAAWTLSEESFMEQTHSWLDMLKIRVGYGLLGNQNIPEYAYMITYVPATINEDIDFEPDDNKLGNPDVTWEKQKQFNIGLDAAFFNDRLSFSVDMFWMKNTDLLMKMSLWPSSGYNYQIANVADMENKGVEFSFNALLVNHHDFKWRVNGNIAHDKNKIKKLYGDVDILWNGGNATSREDNLFVGESLNTLYAFKADRLAQRSDMALVNSWTSIYNDYVVNPGDILPVDVNGDGKITAEDDMTIVGKKDPKFYGGFSTNFSYKNFTLDAVFTYSYGAKQVDWVWERTMDGTANFGPAHEDMLNRWTPENPNTDVPRAYRGQDKNRFGYGNTSFGLLDASYLRCSALSLSYNLPKTTLGKVAENMSLTASANNLFVVTGYKGYDPERGGRSILYQEASQWV